MLYVVICIRDESRQFRDDEELFRGVSCAGDLVCINIYLTQDGRMRTDALASKPTNYATRIYQNILVKLMLGNASVVSGASSLAMSDRGARRRR